MGEKLPGHQWPWAATQPVQTVPSEASLLLQGWVFNVVPWLVAIPASLFSGFLSDRLISQGEPWGGHWEPARALPHLGGGRHPSWGVLEGWEGALLLRTSCQHETPASVSLGEGGAMRGPESRGRGASPQGLDVAPSFFRGGEVI